MFFYGQDKTIEKNDRSFYFEEPRFRKRQDS